jgi:CP family cyanate transporter-like MFS transporter
MHQREQTVPTWQPMLAFAGLILIAANLRAPITEVAPLLQVLQSVFRLSPEQAGLLTAIPLAAFAVISPFVPRIARLYGIERTLFAALVLIACGIGLRSTGALAGLYLGTTIIGVGIAFCNVLVPSLVKRDFPVKVSSVTGYCAITMGSTAALASGTAVPLATAYGWQAALAAAIVLPLGAIALWTCLPRTAAAGDHHGPHARSGPAVWRSPLAWQVTAFMGLNSFLYYVLVAWLPALLTASGYGAASAGSLHGLLQIAAAVPGLFLGPLIGRMKDQTLAAASMGALMALGLGGFAVLPEFAALWTCLFGFGSGACVLLAFIFFGLRSGNPQQAAALSGMAQCVGYLLASTGPTLAGRLHDAAGGWLLPLLFGALLGIAIAVVGWLAGRARTLGL